MKPIDSVEIVENFWAAVWKAQNPEAIDRFVVDDFVLTTGGVDVVSKEKFKQWASAFMARINDFQFEVLETFQNHDGSRVASRWRVSGKNNGLMGTPADQRHISFTGIAVWEVRGDGKLCHNWVERSFFELISSCTRQLREDRKLADDYDAAAGGFDRSAAVRRKGCQKSMQEDQRDDCR